MKNIFLGLLFCSAMALAQNQAKQPKLYSSSQLRSSLMVYDGTFSDNEKKVIHSTNQSGIFNVNEVDIETKQVMPVTKSKTNLCYAIGEVPNTAKVLFESDNSGDEQFHIFYTTDKGKTKKDLTPWKKTRNTFLQWSANKDALFIKSNKRNVELLDIWKIDLKTNAATLFFQNDSLYKIGAISDSERHLSLSKAISDHADELFVYDKNTKIKSKINTNENSNYYGVAFSKDASKFYYRTNTDAEFFYVMEYDLNTKTSKIFYKTNWDVYLFEISKNQKYFTIISNEDAKSKAQVFDYKTKKQIDFPDIKDGSIEDIIVSDSETKFLLTVSTSTSTTNLYVYDLVSKKLTQITSTQNPAVNENDLVQAEIIRFKSFDGLKIPAILYKPLTASATNKVSAIVNVHGGPGGQTRIGYNANIQYLVNHGYAVLCVNNRGSNGYGKTFFALDDKDHGNGDLKDCIWAKKWLQTQNYIKTEAIGIDGGSYGGNLVLNALCLYPNEFKVGIDRYGITNWSRTLKNFPFYDDKKAFLAEMGSDTIHLKQISPIYHYQQIKKPLLVFQGANDVRVLQIESDEIVAGLKKNNIPVEYTLFPNEGHGFMNRENQIVVDEKTLQFLDKYLKTK